MRRIIKTTALAALITAAIIAGKGITSKNIRGGRSLI